MPVLKKYPQELKERAVRLVLDARDEGGVRRGVCTRAGEQLGIPSDTLRGWVQRAEIDQGSRPGTTTDDATKIAELERENRELRRANADPEIGVGFLRGGARPPLNQMIAYM
jgi:transposase